MSCARTCGCVNTWGVTATTCVCGECPTGKTCLICGQQRLSLSRMFWCMPGPFQTSKVHASLTQISPKQHETNAHFKCTCFKHLMRASANALKFSLFFSNENEFWTKNRTLRPAQRAKTEASSAETWQCGPHKSPKQV